MRHVVARGEVDPLREGAQGGPGVRHPQVQQAVLRLQLHDAVLGAPQAHEAQQPIRAHGLQHAEAAKGAGRPQGCRVGVGWLSRGHRRRREVGRRGEAVT